MTHMRNATLFKIVFCYLYIEITFIFIFKSLSNIINLLIVFSHLFLFYYPFKSYDFFKSKMILLKICSCPFHCFYCS